jgi:hypothetical protein
VEVYEFIKASAWRLQDSGLGIVLPPGLAPGAGAKRLGISISAEAPQAEQKRALGTAKSAEVQVGACDRGQNNL